MMVVNLVEKKVDVTVYIWDELTVDLWVDLWVEMRVDRWYYHCYC